MDESLNKIFLRCLEVGCFQDLLTPTSLAFFLKAKSDFRYLCASKILKVIIDFQA